VIVDDDLLVRSMLADLLRSYRDIQIVNTFADGAEALKSVVADPPDVMLVDVSMPEGMGGPELTRLIRERAPSIQILALTSLTDDKTVSAMLRAGALGFLFKDTTYDAVADAIRAARSGLSVLTPQAGNRLATQVNPDDAPALTDTEAKILKLVAEGLTNDQIAKEVYLSPSTVKYHVGMLTDKLGATNRVTLAVRAGEFHLL
jgi:DNA-binding NarL/FixJ family response regulator